MAYSNGTYPQHVLVKVQDGEYLRADAADNYLRMQADAAKEGVTIRINDGYRSYSEQKYMAYKYGLYSQGGRAAYPGTSNHGHGIAIDVTNIGNARYWIARNGHRYGWRGPLAREPWHFDCAYPGLTFKTLQDCPFDKLNKGDRGGDVRFLQARLGIEINGKFDDRTRRKVKEFQRRRGLGVDGVVGPETWLKLMEGSYKLPTIRYGKGGGARKRLFVRILKRRLRDRGYRGFFVNISRYSLGTQRAVRKFQEKKGLKPDGVVGPRTWKELFW